VSAASDEHVASNILRDSALFLPKTINALTYFYSFAQSVADSKEFKLFTQACLVITGIGFFLVNV